MLDGNGCRVSEVLSTISSCVLATPVVMYTLIGYFFDDVFCYAIYNKGTALFIVWDDLP